MRYSSLWIFLLIALSGVAVIGIWANCGGGDDDDDDNDSETDDDSADDDDVDTGDKGKISGCVHDFQTKQPVQGALVEVLNNATGEALGPSATSPSGDACVNIDGLNDDELVGVRVTRDGYKDTLQFNFPNGVTGEEFLIVSEGTASLVAATVGLELDPTKGFAAGGVYWGSSEGYPEYSVGCAKVDFDPANPGNVFYFGVDGLPNPNRAITGDTPTNGQGTNPCCGPEASGADGHYSFYVSINHPIPGPDGISITATAYSDGGNQVETGFAPILSEDSVVISNVIFEDTVYTENPTPSWCTE